MLIPHGMKDFWKKRKAQWQRLARWRKVTIVVLAILFVVGFVILACRNVVGFIPLFLAVVVAALVSERGMGYVVVRALPTLLVVAGFPTAAWWAMQAGDGRRMFFAVPLLYGVLAVAAAWALLAAQAFGTWKEAAKARFVNIIFWATQAAAILGIYTLNKIPDGADGLATAEVGTESVGAGLVALGTFGLVFFLLGAVKDAVGMWAGEVEGTYKQWFVNRDSDEFPQTISRLAARHCSPIEGSTVLCLIIAACWVVISWFTHPSVALSDRDFRIWLAVGLIPVLALVSGVISALWSRRIAKSHPYLAPTEDQAASTEKLATKPAVALSDRDSRIWLAVGLIPVLALLSGGISALWSRRIAATHPHLPPAEDQA